jgi:hypothetical protein
MRGLAAYFLPPLQGMMEVGSFFQKPIIFWMLADPEPDQIVVQFNGQRAMMQADADGPEATGLFQMKGRMP